MFWHKNIGQINILRYLQYLNSRELFGGSQGIVKLGGLRFGEFLKKWYVFGQFSIIRLGERF